MVRKPCVTNTCESGLVYLVQYGVVQDTSQYTGPVSCDNGI